ncbi:hypothetical protein V3C99_015472 [Haemonchus contortus]
MPIKIGGLAAVMSGQRIAERRHGPTALLKSIIRSSALHIGLMVACVIYIYVGALIFKHLEFPHEMELRSATATRFTEMQNMFVAKASAFRTKPNDDLRYTNETLEILIDEYLENLFVEFDNPIARNYFDSIFYNNGEYVESWTMDSAVLFTATTLVPVGFGLVTPLTWWGRLFLIIYAVFGIPLALVTISDIGKFCCDSAFKFFRESTVMFMAVLVILLLLYPFVGGVCIHKVSHLSLFDSIYYCCITILTVGYGDIEPPISVPFLILFIFVGVTLVTISVDVVATNIIHQVHYMGRRMGKARVIADRMVQMAQKININKGLGLGMTQLGAFARIGVMINLTSNGKKISNQENGVEQRFGTAYDPDSDFDLIDRLIPKYYLGGYDSEGSSVTRN